MSKTSASQRQKTIYNSDGTLSGDRTIDGGGHNLTFNNVNGFDINSVGDLSLVATGNTSLGQSTANGIGLFETTDTTAGLIASNLLGTLSQIIVTPNTIQLQPQGYASASAGDVWTNTDPTTGSGAWMASGGGGLSLGLAIAISQTNYTL